MRLMNNPLGHAVCVESCGVTADRLLRQTITFKVLAVFQRSVYLQACVAAQAATDKTSHNNSGHNNSRSDIICVIDASLGNGPLHCCVPDFTTITCSDLKVGARLFNDRESGELRLDTHTTLQYRHRVVIESASRLPVFEGLNGTLPAIESCLPVLQAGLNFPETVPSGNSLWGATLHWITNDYGGESTTQSLQPTTTGWYAALDACAEDIHHLRISPHRSHQFNGLIAMLGRGDGLTPSGDDFVCGVMASFYLINGDWRMQQLQSVLLSAMCSRTHPISAAHLFEACEGQANDSSLAVISALLDVLLAKPSGTNRLTQACDSMGASSGWDFLAGLVMTLYLCQAAESQAVESQAVESALDSQATNLPAVTDIVDVVNSDGMKKPVSLYAVSTL